MACFYEWLLTKEAKEKLFADNHDFNVLVQRLSLGSIGIGSTGVFQITYGFIAQVTLLCLDRNLVTYPQFI